MSESSCPNCGESPMFRSVVHECCVDMVRYASALQRIASMPLEPRADGTHNYCREALIDIARVALGDEGFAC